MPRKPKRTDPGYDEPIKAPDEANEDLELVLRALMDVPRPKDGQATSDDPEPDGK